jgi:hypothetical protein
MIKAEKWERKEKNILCIINILSYLIKIMY